ncbi:MAG: hypothetical protein ACTHOO_07295 [Alcanivorax sp.]
MARVAGSSQYLAQATYSNRTGQSAVSSNLLSNVAGGISLLDVARSAAPSNGIGLSANARSLNNQLLSSNATSFNTLFSLTGGSSATIENAQTQIKALRGSVPASRGVEFDESV